VSSLKHYPFNTRQSSLTERKKSLTQSSGQLRMAGIVHLYQSRP
jgi:hypothetical protein